MQLPAVAESNVCFAHRRLILLNNFSREKWDSIYSKLYANLLSTYCFSAFCFFQQYDGLTDQLPKGILKKIALLI